jgi:hypothetical protein
MKKSIIVSILIISCAWIASAQEIFWRNLNETGRHQVSLHVGLDYGTVYGLSYGYRFPVKQHPVVIGAAISSPFGRTIMDDFKGELTAQTEVWHSGGLSLAVKPGVVFRRYESSAARVYNIGAGLTTTFGYYRNKWGVAVEANYDRNFATYLEHITLRDNYPGIEDGWYRSTGGNFKFGLKGNYWLNETGVSLKVGKVYGQNFSDNPTIPYYTEFAILNRF